MRVLVWTEPAVDDLQAICDFISRDSEYYASVFIGNILDAVGNLVKFPDLGRVVP